MTWVHPAAEHHQNAAQQYEKAACHHREAQRLFAAEDRVAGAHQAHLARAHALKGEHFANEACKAHEHFQWETPRL
ncbi:MAG: hypothetical protein JO256_03815 [Alphaproteobacteria bacterium]|nr:hypothetical protein [Alphaproteobacteria bacterium]